MSMGSQFRITTRLARSLLLLLFLAATGCSVNPLYKTTGQVMTGYAWSESVAYTFEMSDTNMACQTGTALRPFVYSFSRVTDAPLKTGSLLLLLSANCSEQEAWNAQLRSMRDEQKGDVKGAQDARTEYQRWEGITAKRRLKSFREAMKAYDYHPSDAKAKCPYLETPNDQLTFLLGLLTGTQAVLNDSASGHQAQVPQDIAAQAEQAASCLDNKTWAGLPDAIRASVWLLIPSTKPQGAGNPWQVLAHSARLGDKMGMRAAGAIEAVIAENVGNDKVMKQAIRNFAQAGKTMKVWKKYRLVDATSKKTIMAVSDRYWTKHYGRRTPQNMFGKLKPQAADTKAADDNLL